MSRLRFVWKIGCILAVVGLLVGPGYRWILLHELHRTASIEPAFQSLSINPLTGDVKADGWHGASDESRADRMVARLSMSEFLKRRIVVEKGLVQGLHLPDQKITATSLVEENEVPQTTMQSDWFPDGLVGGSGDAIWRNFERDSAVERKRQGMESRWRVALQSLENEKKLVEDEINRLLILRLDAANPLRDLNTLQASIQLSKELSTKLKALQGRIDEVTANFRSDIRDLEEAGKQDLVNLAEKHMVRFQPQSVAQSILREIARSIHRKLDQKSQIPNAMFAMGKGTTSWFPTRGQDFVFTNTEDSSFAIRNGKWTGDVEIGGRHYSIEGRVTDWSLDTDRIQGPQSLTYVLRSGSEQATIQKTRRSSVQGIVESIQVEATDFGHSTWQVTNHQGLTLHCEGSPLRVEQQVFDEDGQRRLVLDIYQEESEFTFLGADVPAVQRLSTEIDKSLLEIAQWQLHAEATGDIDNDANWIVSSNIETTIQDALQNGVRSEIVNYQRDLSKSYGDFAKNIQRDLEAKYETEKGATLASIALEANRLEDFRRNLVAKLESKNPRAIRTANGIPSNPNPTR